MAHDFSETDDFPATVQALDDGDTGNADNFNAGPGALADRTLNLKNSLDHVVSSGALTSSRAVTDGVDRLQSVADLSALTALSVGASDDRKVVYVVSKKNTYTYLHGASDTDDGLAVVESGSAGGFWYAQSPNRLIAVREVTLNPTATSHGTAMLNNATTTFQDASTPLTFDAKAGDILVIEAHCYGQVTTPATPDAFAQLAIVDGGSPVELHNQFLKTLDFIQDLHFAAKHIVANAGSVTVKIRARLGVAGGAANIFAPYRLRALHYRP